MVQPPPPLPNGPVPVAQNAPDVTVFAGGQTCFIEEFVNQSTKPGFGPYLVFIVSPLLTFDSVSFLGSPLTPTFIGTFPATGILPDTISNSAVNGTPGDKLYLIQPPIGSLVTGAPPLRLNICLTSDPLSPINVPI